MRKTIYPVLIATLWATFGAALIWRYGGQESAPVVPAADVRLAKPGPVDVPPMEPAPVIEPARPSEPIIEPRVAEAPEVEEEPAKLAGRLAYARAQTMIPSTLPIPESSRIYPAWEINEVPAKPGLEGPWYFAKGDMEYLDLRGRPQRTTWHACLALRDSGPEYLAVVWFDKDGAHMAEDNAKEFLERHGLLEP